MRGRRAASAGRRVRDAGWVAGDVPRPAHTGAAVDGQWHHEGCTPGRMVGAGARWSCARRVTYREDRAAGEGGNPVAEHGGEVRGVCLYQRG